MNVYIIDHSHTTIFCGGHGQDAPRFHHGYDVAWDIDKVIKSIFKYISPQSEITILDYSDNNKQKSVWHDLTIIHKNGTKAIVNISLYTSCKEMSQVNGNLQSLIDFNREEFNKIALAILDKKDTIGYTVIDNRSSIESK